MFFLRDNEKMYERIKLESLAIKELFIYLSKFNSRANVKKIMSKIKKIKFDPALINDYLSDITSFRASNELTAYAALNVRADRAPWCISAAQMVQRSR